MIAVAYGGEPKHTSVILILPEKGLSSGYCLPKLTILNDANSPIKSKNECLLREVY